MKYETTVEVIKYQTAWKREEKEPVSIQYPSDSFSTNWEMTYILPFNTQGEFKVMFESILTNYQLPFSISSNQNVDRGVLIFHRVEGKNPQFFSPEQLLTIPFEEKSFTISHYFLILTTRLEGEIISSEFLLYPYINN